MAPASLFVAERDGLDTAYQVGERWVHKQVVQRVAVGRCYKLHTTFGDGACRGSFQFGADFIDNDNLRHMVFYRLDHYRVLFYCARHLHTASTSNAGMRNIPIACDFVGGIHHYHTFISFVRQDASYFTQQGCGT